MATERIRIQIGFDGGAVVSAEVEPSEADRIERYLAAGGDGVLELQDEDGKLMVVLSRVLFVKRFERESRVGFGAV